MTEERLQEVLKKHAEWITTRFTNDPKGERANFSGANIYKADLYEADLRGADLRGADLREANLYGADLGGADLRGANLYEADLYRANLRGANLYEADLGGADLRGADLYEADLGGADLREADLRGADLYRANLRGANLYEADLGGADLRGAIGIPLNCPEKGSFTGFKKACGYIVELRITENAKRCSATGRKCRCSEAEVISITYLNGGKSSMTEVRSNYDKDFSYKIGETVKVDNFNENRWEECSPGIHFFITRQEAVEY